MASCVVNIVLESTAHVTDATFSKILDLFVSLNGRIIYLLGSQISKW